MRPTLFIQHEEHITPGTLGRALQAQGVPFQVIRLDLGHELPRPSEVSGIVSLGGTMSVNDERNHPWIPAECDFLRSAIEAGLPVAGLCLGGQLIAKAYGKRVERSPIAEIGWHQIHLTEAGMKDPLLCPMGKSFSVFHWHEETFTELPPGAVLLAESADCRNQAYRMGDRVYGFQFHPEMNCNEVDRWLALPGTEEEIQAWRKKHGERTVQSPSTQRSEGLKAEKKSLQLIAGLGKLLKDS